MNRYRIFDRKAAGTGSSLWKQDIAVQKKTIFGWKTIKILHSDYQTLDSLMGEAMLYVKELMSPSSFVLFDTAKDLDLISNL